jgi:hypothetical protein
MESYNETYIYDIYDYPIGMTRILPGIIGIGPARTGTSAFFLKGIRKHPSIVLGSKKRVLGRGNMELNFFTNEKFLRKGLDFYAKFFDQQKCGVRAEKTPGYSSHPLVPWRIRFLLGSHVQFIFNFRDPFSAFISKYFLKRWYKVGFFEDVLRLEISKYKEFLRCQGKFQNLSIMNKKDFEFDWKTVTQCPESQLVRYDYIRSLRRWAAIFPKNSIICVPHSCLKANFGRTLNIALNMSSLIGNFSPSKPQGDKDWISIGHRRGGILNRTRAMSLQAELRSLLPINTEALQRYCQMVDFHNCSGSER